MDTSKRTPFQVILRRDSLHEQIAEAIQQMIASGQIGRGSQLPSERKLAAQLGVNRATVREAIRLLEQRGLIVMRAGSGAYVFDQLPPSVVGESIERQYVFGGSSSHEDLVALREVLEPETAALAARNATPEQLQRLHDLVERLEEAFFSESPHHAQADMDFHEMLAIAAGNQLIIAISSGLHKITEKWMAAQHEAARLESGCRSHRTIYEAVAARDPDGAREAMRFHMGTTRETLRLVRVALGGPGGIEDPAAIEPPTTGGPGKRPQPLRQVDP